MKVYRALVLPLLIAGIAAHADAQVTPPPPLPPEAGAMAFSWTVEDGQVATFTQGIPVDPVGLVAVEPFETAKPITGAPYSAEAQTEVTQTLADGNRIQRRTTAKIARDSQGRVRREQQAMALGNIVAEATAAIVTITDPVDGTFITLDLERKGAMRMRRGALEMPDNIRFSDRQDVIVSRGAAGASHGMSVGVGGGASIRAYAASEPNLQVDTQPLGSQVIEGVRAEGTRTTTTIPAGAIGNDLPIETVSERWYSPELQVVVLTRRTDPRFGETVYRLANIVRAEPPANLFQIPPDFQIEEPKGVPFPPRRIKPDGR